MCFTDNQRNEAKRDRRISNFGPPQGVRERRSGVDRRQVAITEISLDEWMKYASTVPGLVRRAVVDDAAADVFARAASRD